MSTPLPDKPPVVAMQEELSAIATGTRDAAKKQDAIIVLLADCRDTITDAVKRLQSRPPDTGLQAQLAAILDHVQEPPARRLPWWLWPALLTLTLLLGVGLGWHTCGCPVPQASPTPPTPAAPLKGIKR